MGPITLQVTLNQRLADLLRTNTMQEFVMEQDGRFEHIDGLPPTAAEFRGGTMHWCTTASDALLLRAYEIGRGHNVSLLFDAASLERNPNGSWPDSYVLLTDQPFDEWRQ